jgi:hypothetical protein
LLQDLEIVCWEEEHMNYIKGITICSLLFWGLGIPLLALVLITKSRSTLHTTATKAKYGFIYNGYKPEIFFWEIIIIIRKIILVSFSVFLRQTGIFLQVK